MRSYRIPIIAALLFVVAVGSILHTRPIRSETEPLQPPPTSPYANTVGGVGIVEANTENIAIGTPVAGVIAEVLVTVGNVVTAGDPLFKIDTRKEDADDEVQKAALAAARTDELTQRATLADLENQLRIIESVGDARAVSRDERDRRRYAVEVQRAKLTHVGAQVGMAAAQLHATDVEIDRHTVRAPIDGQLLQVKVRRGEFAPAGIVATPLMLIGNVSPLHVRVDIDEQNAWRVRPDAEAIAMVRGNSALKTPLVFVRFEPYIVPKRSLTGDPTERVDARVLQAIFRVGGDETPLYVGQQVDVFVKDAGVEMATKPISLRSR